MKNFIVKLISKLRLIIVVLVSISLVGLVVLQISLLKVALKNQQEKFNENVNELLLDLHHNIEDDEEFSRQLIDILRRFENQQQIDASRLESATSELNRRIDSLLQARNLNLEKAFVIFDTKNVLTPLQSFDKGKLGLEDFQKRSIKAGWRIKNALGEDRYRIGLYFLNENLFLLKQVSVYLIISLLFIFILVISFAMTMFALSRMMKYDEMKNGFINNLTHELKTPVFSSSLILNVFEKKLNGKGDAVKFHKYIGLLERENDKLKQSINKVLDIAVLENDKLKMDFKTSDIHQIIRHSAETQRFLAETKNGEILFNLKASDYHAMADPIHLENVISNLLDNAVKYTKDKPEILISSKNVNSKIQIDIEDNGIGLKAGDRLDVFNKFYRVSTGNHHEVKGYGLGLSYVKMIVESHSGEIKVESKPGKGSKFTITLPQNR